MTDGEGAARGEDPAVSTGSHSVMFLLTRHLLNIRMGEPSFSSLLY